MTTAGHPGASRSAQPASSVRASKISGDIRREAGRRVRYLRAIGDAWEACPPVDGPPVSPWALAGPFQATPARGSWCFVEHVWRAGPRLAVGEQESRRRRGGGGNHTAPVQRACRSTGSGWVSILGLFSHTAAQQTHAWARVRPRHPCQRLLAEAIVAAHSRLARSPQAPPQGLGAGEWEGPSSAAHCRPLWLLQGWWQSPYESGNDGNARIWVRLWW